MSSTATARPSSPPGPPLKPLSELSPEPAALNGLRSYDVQNRDPLLPKIYIWDDFNSGPYPLRNASLPILPEGYQPAIGRTFFIFHDSSDAGKDNERKVGEALKIPLSTLR